MQSQLQAQQQYAHLMGQMHQQQTMQALQSIYQQQNNSNMNGELPGSVVASSSVMGSNGLKDSGASQLGAL